MANGLAHSGMLSAQDRRWWRSMNDYTNSLYADPEVASPGAHDIGLNPGARSCFKHTYRPALVETTRHYLDLLDRYEVPWLELRTDHPGRIVYEDADQVVAVPLTHSAWRLPTTPGP